MLTIFRGARGTQRAVDSGLSLIRRRATRGDCRGDAEGGPLGGPSGVRAGVLSGAHSNSGGGGVLVSAKLQLANPQHYFVRPKMYFVKMIA